MTCTRVELGPGSFAVVCGRGLRPVDEEAVILEDVRRQLALRGGPGAG